MTPRTTTGKRLWPKPGPAYMDEIAAETRRNILAIEEEAMRMVIEEVRGHDGWIAIQVEGHFGMGEPDD